MSILEPSFTLGKFYLIKMLYVDFKMSLGIFKFVHLYILTEFLRIGHNSKCYIFFVCLAPAFSALGLVIFPPSNVHTSTQTTEYLMILSIKCMLVHFADF